MASNMVQQSSPERKLTYCAERNQKFVEFQRKCTEKLLRWSSWIRKKFFQVFRSNTTELCNTEHQKTSKYIKILLIISIVYYYILYDSRRYYYHILYWPLSAIFCEPRAALRLCAEALQALAKVSHLAVVTLPRHPKISEVRVQGEGSYSESLLPSFLFPYIMYTFLYQHHWTSRYTLCTAFLSRQSSFIVY